MVTKTEVFVTKSRVSFGTKEEAVARERYDILYGI